MARIFKQQYTKRDGNGCKVRRMTEKWYIEFVDGQGVRRRKPGFTDKKATAQLGAELERRAAREATGLIDRFDEHRKRSLCEHVDDWNRSLLDNGSTTQYAQLSKNRVQAILEGTKAIYWGEIDANRVAAYLAERRSQGLSVESSNHYLRRIKQFSRWMVKSKRAPDNPMDCLSILTRPPIAATSAAHSTQGS